MTTTWKVLGANGPVTIYFSGLVFTNTASVIITDHPWWMFSHSCLLANGRPIRVIWSRRTPAQLLNIRIAPHGAWSLLFSESFRVILTCSWHWDPPLWGSGRCGCTGIWLQDIKPQVSDLGQEHLLPSTPLSSFKYYQELLLPPGLRYLILAYIWTGSCSFPFVKCAWISVIWALRPCLARLQELQLPIYPYLPCRGLCGCSGWWGGGQCVLSCSLTDASPPLTTLEKFCHLQRSEIFHATCSLEPSRLCSVLSTLSFPLG